MRCIHLANNYFLEFDRGSLTLELCAVRVTDECYERLLKEGYILSYDTMIRYLNRFSARSVGCKTFGGQTGFTYEELMDIPGENLKEKDILAFADQED